MKVKNEATFWLCVNKCGPNDCWEWKKARKPTGYGQVGWNRKNRRAHRVAWELTNGPIPSGLNCLHRCDNPPCCNPNHLFLGTQPENIQDAKSKGRIASGERAGMSKLTAKQVEEIRKRYVPRRVTGNKLALEYGITQQAVSKIVNRQRWQSAA